MTKVLVVGGFGLVGTEVFRYLKREKFDVYRSHHRRIPYGNGKRVHINLQNETTFGLVLAEIKPDIVYLCAAYTNVDKCETEPIAFDINVTGTNKFIEECHRRDIQVVFYSSSYVFDGTKEGPYTEEDCPHPINRYGMYKMEVEGYVLSKPTGLVIRTVGVFGDDHKNFKSRVLALRDDYAMSVPENQFINPIHAADLAEWSVEAQRMGVTGILNVAGSAGTSKCDWAKRIRWQAKLSSRCIWCEDVPQIAPRPRMGELKISKLRELIPSAYKVYPELAFEY